MKPHALCLNVNDSTQVFEARRAAQVLATELGFNEAEVGRVAIVATEAATNLVKHAKGGQVLIRSSSPETLDIAVLDKGPGIGDIDACLRDGYSSVGTMGGGLGAIQRLAGQSEFYTLLGKGTAVFIRCSRNGGMRHLEIDGISVPLRGESVCGDAWTCVEDERGCTVCVADGLGHGHGAATASGIAIETFREYSHLRPAQILERLHPALRPTRGAAVSVFQWDTGARSAVYAGVGNIAGVILSASDSRHMVSMNGTLGHEARHFREFEYSCNEESTVILHSDGIQTRWDLGSYPGLLHRPPCVIAGVLYRDFARPHDDATVVVIKRR